jgi:hypothetical protein
MRVTEQFGNMTRAEGLHDQVLESHDGAPCVAPDIVPRLGSLVGG